MSQLLDQLRNEIRVRHYSIRTEQTHIHWVTRKLAPLAASVPAQQNGAITLDRRSAA